MSSTKKGDAFEARVYEMIKGMLASDALPIPSKYCQVYCKKGYYSASRGKPVIIDVSVECTLPGAPHPSTYIIIECKDLGRGVDVSDMAEFCTKVQEITAFNVKPIFVTSNRFQEGAFNLAVSKAIWLMKLSPDGTRETLSFRKERSPVSQNSRDFINAQLALTSENSLFNPSQIGIGPGKVYHNLSVMLSDILSN